MNEKDRKRLAETQAKLQELTSTLVDACTEVRGLAEAEREKFDNLSEGLQNGERGQAISEAADALEEMADKLDESLEALEEFNGHDIP